MGYTHSWHKEKELPQDKWDKFIEEAKIVLSDARVLWEEYDKPDTKPVLNGDMVWFNGIEEDGHETFYFSRVVSDEEFVQKGDDGKYFSFCKTAYKPYDKYVVRMLVLAEKHFGNAIRINSDGDWTSIAKATLYDIENELP